MREEKPKSPSQKNKSSKKNSFLWPAIYASIAIVVVGMIWGYNALLEKTPNETADQTASSEAADQLKVETNAQAEVLKYPFNEELFDEVAILQEYYDATADDEMRESALLVFDQTYVTNKGLSISIGDQPFEALAAMSGTVQEVIIDQFRGSEITIAHTGGLSTVYGSLTDIAVKEGDEVIQGQPLGMTTSNEWNAKAGNHLHFQVHVDGVPTNPRTYLGF